MKRQLLAFVVSACAVSLAFGALADGYEFIATDADADWTLPANYRLDGQPTGQLPPSGATVKLVPGLHRVAVPSPSFDRINTFNRLVPTRCAVLEFDVSGSEYTNSCEFSSGYDGSCKDGKIVKKGVGTLVLATRSDILGSGNDYGYYVDMTVEAGALKLPQYVTTAYAYYGQVAVSNGATLFTSSQSPESNLAAFSMFRSLYGEGTVKNVKTPGSSRSGHSMAVSGNGDERSVFSGTIEPQVTLYNMRGAGEIALLGTNSTFGTLYVGGGRGDYPASVKSRVSLVKIGSTGETKSSIGNPANAIIAASTSVNDVGILEYLGKGGETSPRNLNHYTKGRIYIDAGAHGGVRFNGNVEAGHQAGAAFYSLHRLCLTGSNTTACVVAGDLKPHVATLTDAACTNFPVYVTKQGVGTWRFVHLGTATGTGGFAIEDGTLQFDSIAERGKPCALGLATQTTACDPEALTDKVANYVPYAYALGHPTDAAAKPVFEYTGAGSLATCSTRPLVLVGAGGEIRNSTAYPFSFSGVSARDAGATTLVLGGDNTAAVNSISCVSNGAGTVGLTKTGAGKWRLHGTNTFSGPVRVEAGELILRGPAYSWFRFTIKKVQGWTVPSVSYGGETYYGVVFGELALYDKDGVRRNLNLEQPWPDRKAYPYWFESFTRNYRDIPSGGCEFDAYAAYFYNGSVMGTQGNYNISDASWAKTLIRRPDVLFDDNVAKSGGFFFTKEGDLNSPGTSPASIPKTRMPTPDDSDTWLPIVMRLPEGTPEITSYDVCSGFATATDRWPLGFTLEGSHDGVNWMMLDDRTDFDYAALTNKHAFCWYSDLSAFEAGKARTGFAFARRPETVLPNVGSVSVASGAALAGAGGYVLSKVTLGKTDTGVFRNLEFAAEGELNLTGDIGQCEVMGATFENVTGLENLRNWTVIYKDKVTERFDVRVENGRVIVCRKGMLILVL